MKFPSNIIASIVNISLAKLAFQTYYFNLIIVDKKSQELFVPFYTFCTLKDDFRVCFSKGIDVRYDNGRNVGNNQIGMKMFVTTEDETLITTRNRNLNLITVLEAFKLN